MSSPFVNPDSATAKAIGAMKVNVEDEIGKRTMNSRERGKRCGEQDARNAWIGSSWVRPVIALPTSHFERQEFLAGYASGVAEYNRSIRIEEPGC